MFASANFKANNKRGTSGEEEDARSSVPLEMSVSRQSPADPNAINLPSSRIEKPKRNFDHPRSIIRSRGRPVPTFSLAFLFARALPRTNRLLTPDWFLKRSHEEVHLGQILTSHIAFRAWFRTDFVRPVSHFCPTHRPRLAHPLAPPYPSVQLWWLYQSQINFANSLRTASFPSVPPPLPCRHIIELQEVNRSEYCSRSIRELMGTPLPI